MTIDNNMQFRLSTLIDDKMNDLMSALVHTEVGTPSHTELWDELELFRALGDMAYELQEKDKRIEELEDELEDSVHLDYL